MSEIADTKARTLRLEWTIDAPPEKLWRALTVREYLEQWLLAADADPAANEPEKVDFEVVDADPPRRLEWRWRELGRDEASESSVVFHLTPAIGGGTRLSLEQRALRIGVPLPANSNQTLAMAA